MRQSRRTIDFSDRRPHRRQHDAARGEARALRRDGLPNSHGATSSDLCQAGLTGRSWRGARGEHRDDSALLSSWSTAGPKYAVGLNRANLPVTPYRRRNTLDYMGHEARRMQAGIEAALMNPETSDHDPAVRPVPKNLHRRIISNLVVGGTRAACREWL